MEKKTKKISTFLEFETEDTSKEKQDSEFGLLRSEAKKLQKDLKHKAYVICPLCGLNRPLNKTGGYYIQKSKAKGKTALILQHELRKTRKHIKSERAKKYNPRKYTSFNIVNIEDEPFISVRISLGRGRGFKEVSIIKLSDIPSMPERDKEILIELVGEIREQCQKILDYTEDLI